MQLFDTHAHLDQADFDADRAEVVARAREAGVENIIAIGTTARRRAPCACGWPANSRACTRRSACSRIISPKAKPGDWDRIVALAREPGVVAIGETGLDRHWDFTPFDVQQDYFDRHMRLSQERGLPFVVHMRDCDDDILAMLREAHAAGRSPA